jgi:hypothetical protein
MKKEREYEYSRHEVNKGDLVGGGDKNKSEIIY